jgi:hypothetical protein
MNALQVAARFTAFTCYLNADPEHPRCPEDAGNFARENWRVFLPFVDRDLARFLTKRPRARRVRYGRGSTAAMRHGKARVAG